MEGRILDGVEFPRERCFRSGVVRDARAPGLGAVLQGREVQRGEHLPDALLELVHDRLHDLLEHVATPAVGRVALHALLTLLPAGSGVVGNRLGLGEHSLRMMRPMTDAHPSGPERSSEHAGSHLPLTIDAGIDRRVVEGQIGRPPRAMAGVAARCAFGLPAVTRQAPTDDAGRPFPTAYYLTCPHLVRQVDRLEAAGGVRRYEELLASDAQLRAATDRSHERHRALDDRGANIAASSDPARLKCLHAHAAFALAAGDHPLGEQVLAEAAPRWCDDARCVALAPAVDAE